MDWATMARILTGYVLSCVVGQYVTAWCVNHLWKLVPENPDSPTLRPPPWIRFWHGVAERGLYTSAICLGTPEGIGIWLAFKAVMRWRVYEQDPRHIPGSPIYMIGTILSLAFGIVGGLIATWRLSL